MIFIMHFDDPSLYISPKKKIVLTIQVPDEFVKNNREPAPLHTTDYYRYARARLAELHVLQMEQ